MNSPQMQANIAAARSPNQPTSAQTGFTGAGAPPGFQNPTPTAAQLAGVQASDAQLARVNPSAAAMFGIGGGGAGMKKGGRVRTFDSTKPAPGNLATSQAGKCMAEGGAVKAKKKKHVRSRKPKAADAPPPEPAYDSPDAGDDGWPPTPSFTGAPGPQGPTMAPPPTPMGAGPGMKKGGPLFGGAIKHPGALREELNTPKGENIPAKKLAKAAKAPGKLGERARLAETMKGFKKAKGGECDKMAAGGAAKVRRGFPNTNKAPKAQKLAKGGSVRGSGVAQRGTSFSGIY